jgi:hypothetical protein
MNANGKVFSKLWLMSAAGCLLFGASGCKSHSPTTKTTDEKPSGAAPQNPGPIINLNCIFDRMGNPSEAFHYSYSRHGQSDFVTQEADVTPQNLDGTVNSMRDGQTNPPEPVHAVHSDSDGWRMGVGHLSVGFGMPAVLQLANQMTSALVREGSEKVNGYDTVRYSIDTARLTAADRALLGTSSEKGIVWVTGPGCPVKITMDTETQANDGSISKIHYEEAMIKK